MDLIQASHTYPLSTSLCRYTSLDTRKARAARTHRGTLLCTPHSVEENAKVRRKERSPTQYQGLPHPLGVVGCLGLILSITWCPPQFQRYLVFCKWSIYGLSRRDKRQTGNLTKGAGVCSEGSWYSGHCRGSGWSDRRKAQEGVHVRIQWEGVLERKWLL